MTCEYGWVTAADASVEAQFAVAAMDLFSIDFKDPEHDVECIYGYRWCLGPWKFGRVWRVRGPGDSVYTTYLTEDATVAALTNIYAQIGSE